MDRIGEALERARHERERRVNPPPAADDQAMPAGSVPVMPIGLPQIKAAHVAAVQPVPNASVPSSAQPSTAGAGAPAADVAPAVPATRSPTAPAVRNRQVDIVYTKTRQVSVAEDQLRANRVITGDEHDEFTQAFKILRTQIVHAMRDNGWNAIAITSPGDADGKTVTAINLAIHLAAELDRTVLLVDANLRQPELHSYFGLGSVQGLSDFLVDQVPIHDLMINPGIERLVILPGGRALPNSAEMLGSPMMQDLVDELKNRYPQRIVLFDLPPVLSASDALAFAPYVDATILVAAQGHTRHHDLERATELLGSTTNLLGVVLNKTSPEDGRKRVAEPSWRRWFRRTR